MIRKTHPVLLILRKALVKCLPVKPLKFPEFFIVRRRGPVFPSRIHGMLSVVTEKFEPGGVVVVYHAEKIVSRPSAPRRRFIVAARVKNTQHVVDQVIHINQDFSIGIHRAVRFKTKQGEVVAVVARPIQRPFKQLTIQFQSSISHFSGLHPPHGFNHIIVFGFAAKIGGAETPFRPFLGHEDSPIHPVHVNVVIAALGIVMPAFAL